MDIAYYTVFCGVDKNRANVVMDPPSKNHKCYYFSDNTQTLEISAKKGWIPIVLHNGIPVDDPVESAKRSKYLKAVPNRYSELEGFRYLVYVDSKKNINEAQVEDVIEEEMGSAAYFLKLHPVRAPDVWDEFIAAIKQPRYERQKEMMESYIFEQTGEHGLSAKGAYIFWTCFIIRDTLHPSTIKINETWMSHIEKCGIECQISFFFIYQLFHEYIKPDIANKIIF